MRHLTFASIVATSFLAVVAIAIMIAGTAAAQTPDTMIIEQYKAYMGDLGNIGSRYATAQTLYVSIISTLIATLSALIAIFSYKEMGKPKRNYLDAPFLACGVVFLFIWVVCHRWTDTLDFYSQIFDVKFTLLSKMELTHPNLYPIFTQEAPLRPKPGLIVRDAQVARDIGVAALVMAIVMLIGTVAKLIWVPGRKRPIDAPRRARRRRLKAAAF